MVLSEFGNNIVKKVKRRFISKTNRPKPKEEEEERIMA
jgi:hypothetical protein